MERVRPLIAGEALPEPPEAAPDPPRLAEAAAPRAPAVEGAGARPPPFVQRSGHASDGSPSARVARYQEPISTPDAASDECPRHPGPLRPRSRP